MSEEKKTERVTDRIDKYILENSRGTMRPSEVLLNEDDYKQFLAEIEPIYKKVYGALITSFECGYQNVLYRGIPVCLNK